MYAFKNVYQAQDASGKHLLMHQYLAKTKSTTLRNCSLTVSITYESACIYLEYDRSI